jgi:hypothetical protein
MRGRVDPTPWVFFVTFHSKDVKAVCFDTVLQVFILKDLGRAAVGASVTVRCFRF